MTRQEFIDDITTWGDLFDFCSDEGCYICDGIYDSDDWNSCIDDEVYEIARNNTWRVVLSILQDYDDQSGYDYHARNDYGEWHGLDDDDFDAYKDDVLEWGDNQDVWGEEDEEEEPRPKYVNPEDTIPLELEDVSIDDLFMAGIKVLNTSQNTVSDEVELEDLLTA